LRKTLIVLVWQKFKAIVTVWTVPGVSCAWKNRKIIELMKHQINNEFKGISKRLGEIGIFRNFTYPHKRITLIGSTQEV